MAEPFLVVAVSFPPPFCEAYSRRGGGMAYPLGVGRQYMEITSARIRQAMLSNGVYVRQGVTVTAEVFPPDKRKRDPDSLSHILTDCLWLTGWQVPAVTVDIRQPRPRPGGCVLMFWE